MTFLEKLQIRVSNGLKTGLKYLTYGAIAGVALLAVGAFTAGVGGGIGLALTQYFTGIFPTLSQCATIGAIGAAGAFGLGFLSGMLDDKPVAQAEREEQQTALLAQMQQNRQNTQLAAAQNQSQQLDVQTAQQLAALGLQPGAQPAPGAPATLPWLRGPGGPEVGNS